MHECDLAGIPLSAEHALAEERGTQRYAIKAADQRIVVPGLHAVGVPLPVQRAVGLEDGPVDPGFGPAPGTARAAAHDAGEIAVHGDPEAPSAHRAREPAGHVKAVQRDDAAGLGIDPEDITLRLALRHGEEPAARRPAGSAPA